MLIDNFGIISQVQWHVKTRQNQDIFKAKCENCKIRMPVRRLDAGTM